MSSSNYETPSSTSLSELTTMDESAASCLMLLSKVGEWSSLPPPTIEKSFDCKTCGKVFSTFQALGGHRASHKHKKPKLDHADQPPSIIIPAKPRSHTCYICGAEFALGQALGGHMRRHKDSSTVSNKQQQSARETTVLMRSNSKRVCLDLDLDLDLSLNLTPPGKNDDMVMAETDLKLQLGKREYEMEKSMDMGRLQAYDLRMQMCKRRCFGDEFLGLVS